MSLTHYLLDIIFPPACLACKDYLKNGGEKSDRLCANCLQKLGYLPGFLCPVCFRRLPTGVLTKVGLPTIPCHKDAQFILAAPLSYTNPVARELIQTLKYSGIMSAAEPLASVLAEYLTASIRNSSLDISNFILVPIPLHRTKERERGFNQALVIAENLKNALKIGNPLLTDILIKARPTPSQTKKGNKKAREENIRGSFEVKKPEFISHKNILLVDDVFTSGATMREAARVLKTAGAKKIIAVTVARA